MDQSLSLRKAPLANLNERHDRKKVLKREKSCDRLHEPFFVFYNRVSLQKKINSFSIDKISSRFTQIGSSGSLSKLSTTLLETEGMTKQILSAYLKDIKMFAFVPLRSEIP